MLSAMCHEPKSVKHQLPRLTVTVVFLRVSAEDDMSVSFVKHQSSFEGFFHFTGTFQERIRGRLLLHWSGRQDWAKSSSSEPQQQTPSGEIARFIRTSQKKKKKHFRSSNLWIPEWIVRPCCSSQALWILFCYRLTILYIRRKKPKKQQQLLRHWRGIQMLTDVIQMKS